MSIRQSIGAQRVATPVAESFQSFAYAELQAAPIHTHGECLNVDCCKSFEPKQATQMFCSSTCKRASHAEKRNWANRVSDALLVWREWKYSKDPKQQLVVRMARRFITREQTAWMNDRAARREVSLSRRKRKLEVVK